MDAGESCGEKEAWVSRVLLEWGSCGRVAYVDDDPAGYVLYAPPVVPPGRRRVPDRAGQRGRGAAGHRDGLPEYAGGGLGRVLMQTVVKDLVKRGGIRAVEAFGDTRAAPRASKGDPAPVTYGTCVLPADYLLRVGFKTHRPHPRYPRMRLELKSAVTWRDEVESALERLLGAVRPARHPAADPSHRTERRRS